jgi:hypothetical protein
VNDRESLTRIVTEVLSGNLDLFIAQYGELDEMRRLKESADRLLALGAAISPGVGTRSFAREHEVCAARPDERR